MLWKKNIKTKFYLLSSFDLIRLPDSFKILKWRTPLLKGLAISFQKYVKFKVKDENSSRASFLLPGFACIVKARNQWRWPTLQCIVGTSKPKTKMAAPYQTREG